jgi:hypothetical protein
LTTDTLEGVDTPVTEPPPLLLEEPPPLHAESASAREAAIMHGLKMKVRILLFIMDNSLLLVIQ